VTLTPATKARLIYNPIAGPRDLHAQLEGAVELLRSNRWEVEWHQCDDPRVGAELARDAAQRGYSIVLAAGGDGTIGKIVNGLAHSETALGVLPCGTGNVWAMEMGIPAPGLFHPNAPLEAARILLTGETRFVDLGMAGDHYFLMWAGVGYDAQVTREVNPDMRKQFGNLAVWATGLRVAHKYRGTQATIRIGSRTISKKIVLVLLGNNQLYGGVVRITAMARVDDGLLDMCVLKGKGGLPSILYHLARLLARTHLYNPNVEYYQGESAFIETEMPLPVQADGDPIGTTPMEFRIAPKSLRVVLPTKVSPRLFTEK
jgi:diacylglycerol kinase (ATP)